MLNSIVEEGLKNVHEHIRKGFAPKMIEIITGRQTQVEIPARIAR